METKRFHSVRLDVTRCKGCTNCLKRCPTEAIRVRDGRAHIIDERCIDCGECIRVCAYHAKVAQTDPLSSISQFKYKIALPAPSLYGQFKGLQSVGRVLTGLKRMGFDDVFEVARAADVVTRAIREKMRRDNVPRPLISSACPAITRLIQVRFPDLIPHIVDVRQPMELAAIMARREFCKIRGVKPEEVGCFFITPCAAKVTAIRSPIGHEKSAVDGAISIMEIYGLLSSHTRGQGEQPEELPGATSFGVSSVKQDPILLTVLQIGVAAVFSWIVAPFMDGGFPAAAFNADIVVSMLYLGLLSTMMAFFLQNVCQKYTQPSTAAILLSTESVFGVVFSVALLGEKLTLRMMTGCILIFIAIILAETKIEGLFNRKS
jgi:Fe-S-cluster-containing hydrogenase component 2/uncharacterized membrane protein